MKNSITSSNPSSMLSNSSVTKNFAVKAILFMLMILVAFTAQAATKTWTGTTSSAWNNQANWSPSGVPGTGDDVIIPNVSTNDPIKANGTGIRSLTVESGGYLTIQSGSTLNIDNSTNDGINNSGQIDNFGTIEIGSSSSIGGTGIINDGTFTNDGGTINIDDAGERGIYNKSNADFDNLNNAEIWIGQNNDITSNAIFNNFFAVFTNDNSDIYIDNVTNAVAVNNKGEFNNQNGANINIGKNDGNILKKGWINWQSDGQLTNDASTIDIGNTGDDGIENRNAGKINNQNGGIIMIGQDGDNISGHAIDNYNSNTVFTNDNATIIIGNSGNNGIYNSNSGQFDNVYGGTIDIGQDGSVDIISENGIDNESTFNNNNSTISIDEVGSSGILNSGSGQFDNLDGGLIKIGQNTGDIPVNGISNANSGIFNNDNSSIRIDDTGANAISNISSGQFDNLNGGLIRIGLNVGYVSTNGISNEAVFNNNNSTIRINDTDSNGILNSGSGQFENLNGGAIYLGLSGGANNIAEYGIYNNKSFKNNTGSSVIIDNTVLDGLYHNSGTFTNAATIDIGQNAGANNISNNGIYINSTFKNNTGGNINIDNTVLDGIDHSSGTSITTFNNLEIDKASNDLKLLQEVNVDNQLQMTAGNLNLNGYDLTLGTTNGTIISESASSYIYSTSTGEVIKVANLNAPNNENPGNIGVNITSSANLGTTTIKRGHVIQVVNGEQGIVRYYDISPSNNSGLDATVQFSYLDHELNGSAENDLAPFRYNGVDWDEYLATSNDETNNWVETNAVDAFSVWTLAMLVVPLPVELFSFTATRLENKVELDWATAGEERNKGFSVERKTAFEDWTAIGFVDGNGTTTDFSYYDFIDWFPETGNNYYRLKQIDFDGAFEYSNIRVVKFEKARINISIYPNPTSDVVNIQFDETINGGVLQLFDQLGRLILQETISDSEYLKIIPVNQLPEGIYFIKIIAGDQRFSEIIIVQKSN